MAPGAGFLDWWMNGLMLWLKPAARARWCPPQPRVWLRVNAEGWTGWVGTGTPATSVVALRELLSRHPDLPCWLLLDGGNAVRATLQLPLAAIDHLRQTARYDIDRQTPYSENDVAYDARVTDLDVAGKRITAELLAVPKTRLDPLVERVGQDLGVALHGVDVDVADAEGRPLGVNLLEQRAPLHRPWRWINLALLAVVAIALSLTMWRSVVNARVRADNLDASLKQQTDRARAITLQRQRLDDLVGGAKKVQTEQSRHADLGAIANALAERLPASVYVERMSLQDGQLQLSGQGASAATALSYLQANPLWETPSLSGGGMSGASYGRERFSVAMRLKPKGAR